MTDRDPVMNIAITPTFFFVESCRFEITGIGMQSKYMSLAMLNEA